jgi:hypothetical protein
MDFGGPKRYGCRALVILRFWRMARMENGKARKVIG